MTNEDLTPNLLMGDANQKLRRQLNAFMTGVGITVGLKC
jgi:hypothetical protein